MEYKIYLSSGVEMLVAEREDRLLIGCLRRDGSISAWVCEISEDGVKSYHGGSDSAIDLVLGLTDDPVHSRRVIPPLQQSVTEPEPEPVPAKPTAFSQGLLHLSEVWRQVAALTKRVEELEAENLKQRKGDHGAKD